MNDQESISSQWNTTTLGELIDKDNGSIQTGPFGTTLKAAEYSKKGVPLISVRELVDGRVEVDQKTPKVNQHTLDRLPQYILQKGDIVFGRKGSVERSALIRDREHGWFLGSDGIRIRLHEYVDMRFIHYQVRSREASTWLLQHASGTTMPSMNQKILRKLPITLPPLPEQKAIASILGSLDDKIELNNQMNQTLETMARALYKSWFVDFDPGVAKAAGKRPFGMDDETAALFPNRFVDSELGPIPEGWEVSNLGSAINLHDNKRVPLSKHQRLERRGSFRYYGAAGILDYVDDYIFNGCYLLLGEDGSVITEEGQAITQYVWGKFWVNNHAHVIEGKNNITVEQLLLHMTQVDILPYVTGAVQPKINQKNLKSVPFIKASDEVINVFNDEIQSYFDLYRSNSDEIMTLSRLRNLLLPKLISGEIRIKDAEKVVEEAL